MYNEMVAQLILMFTMNWLIWSRSCTVAELRAQPNVSKATQQRSAEPEMLAGAQLPGRSDE